jgi:hypothetical protein
MGLILNFGRAFNTILAEFPQIESDQRTNNPISYPASAAAGALSRATGAVSGRAPRSSRGQKRRFVGIIGDERLLIDWLVQRGRLSSWRIQ